jgi:carbon storage regulator
MLVLSRKVGERLVIGGNITVVVSRVAGNRVTIGIEAPDDVRIVRGELKPEAESIHSDANRAVAKAAVHTGHDTREFAVPRLAK